MFIGRKEELRILTNVTNEKGRKLIATIGRRGNGKTTLHNFFKEKISSKNYKIIEFSGIKNMPEKKQVLLSSNILNSDIFQYNWQTFFNQLEQDLKTYQYDYEKIFIFIDEFAWLHTKQSNFLDHFSVFWNKLTNFDNVYCLITSSAVSWMNKNVLRNVGGLYHKVDCLIKLKSFSLEETKEYLKNIKGINNNKEILDYYLLTGGIPRYLNKINKNDLFERNAYNVFNTPISNEFDNLFNSVFSSNNIHSKIVELFKKQGYITIKEISEKLNKTPQTVENAIEDLLASDLISKEQGIKNKERNIRYYLSDLFCLNFIKIKEFSEEYFRQQQFFIRNGYNLELAIQNNIDFINKHLSRSGFEHKTYKLFLNEDDKKSQIDLVIDYNNGRYSILEIKNKKDKYVIDKEEYFKITKRYEMLQHYLKENKVKNPVIDIIFVSLYGIEQREKINYTNVIDFNILDYY